jgi:hypothetical protein
VVPGRTPETGSSYVGQAYGNKKNTTTRKWWWLEELRQEREKDIKVEMMENKNKNTESQEVFH